MKIDIAVFSGTRPAVASHLLALEQAQVADNCRLDSGEIRPLRRMLPETRLATRNVEDVYRHDGQWLIFHEPVSVCRSLLAGDPLGRLYFTGQTSGPRMLRSPGSRGGVPLSVRLGLPAPEVAPQVRAMGQGDETEVYCTYYLFTLVSELGEESAPSPPSALLDVQDGQSVEVSGLAVPDCTDRNPVTHKRIYRANTGSTDTVEQFVAEIPVNQDRFTDEKSGSELGAALATEGWLEPPAGLQGLTAVAGGSLAGFVENQLYFSEPFAPYAWPRAYSHSLEHCIAAQAATGGHLAVLTDAAAYLVACDDVRATSPRKLEGYAPCVGPRGVVETSRGVLFPGVDGLYLVNGGSVAAENVTRGVLSEEAWRELRPETFRAWPLGDQYLCFHEDARGVRRGFVFDLAAPQTLRGLWMHARAGYLEPEGRRLHLARESGGRTSVELWEGDAVRYSAQWKSRKYCFPSPVNMAAAQVDAEYPPVLGRAEYEAQRAELAAGYADELGRGELGGSPGGGLCGGVLFAGDLLDTVGAPYGEQPVLWFQYFVDGREVYARNVTRPGPFALPPASGREVEVCLSGAVPVRRITLASGMAELRRSG